MGLPALEVCDHPGEHSRPPGVSKGGGGGDGVWGGGEGGRGRENSGFDGVCFVHPLAALPCHLHTCLTSHILLMTCPAVHVPPSKVL